MLCCWAGVGACQYTCAHKLSAWFWPAALLLEPVGARASLLYWPWSQWLHLILACCESLAVLL